MTKSVRTAATAPRSAAQSSTTTTAFVARVQGAVAHQNGGGVPKGSYVGRMQQTVAKTGK